MPILQIELVEDEEPAESPDPELTRRLADAAAAALDAPGRTWVRLRWLARHAYCEDGGLPDGVRPVFVEVLLARRPPQAELRERARALAAALATVCGRPVENVHVLFQEDAAGRIAFGGELVEAPPGAG